MLWELYSYGRVPYPRVVSELTVYTSQPTTTTHCRAVDDISQYVEKGYRMECTWLYPDQR